MLGSLVSRDRLLATLLVLAASVVCARLGIWQLDRLSQRRAFNARVKAVQEMPAVSLPTHAHLVDQEYRAVHATGTYDFGEQVAVRNQFHDGAYGFHLVTPLVLAGPPESNPRSQQAVLVDRGWIPADGNGTPSDWAKYDVEGEVSVDGVVRTSETAPSFLGLAEPTPPSDHGRLDFWTVIDIGSLQKQVEYTVLPIYIQQSAPANASEPPIPEALALDLSEGPHLGYAMQWFGFAALFVAGYPLYVHRQEARRR